jgi:Chaperone of endosialidase
MKKIFFASILCLGLGYSQSANAQICNSGDIIVCPGRVLGHENAGQLGQFPGFEEWFAIGKSPFPAPSGDFVYGIRNQREQSFSLFQLEESLALPGNKDTRIASGFVALPFNPGNGGYKLPHIEFDFSYQDQTFGFPIVTNVNIATMTPADSKVITATGTTLFCGGPAPCFGRVGIENNFPDYTLDVNGVARMTGLLVVSDARYKTDVNTIENGLNVVKQLRGTTYEFNTEEKFETFDFDNGLQSGFIAQEVEKVLPHSVFTDSKGYKSVNYVAVVPYLIEAVKELSTKNDDLQAQLDALRSGDASGKGAASVFDGVSTPAELFQNVPNPFNGVTEIRYSLPETVRAASLIVFDMNGKQLRSFDIAERGMGSVRLQANELSSGMYLYTLLADGKEIGTRRMIITE